MKFIIISLLFSKTLFSNFNVVTTTTDLESIVYDLTKNIKNINVYSLSKAKQDVHYLNATPGMIVRISKADLFIENGLDLEIAWLPKVLAESRNNKVKPGSLGYLNASHGLEAIQIPESIHRDKGDVHPLGNPHYTLDPLKTLIAYKNIKDALIRLDSKNSKIYDQNYNNYFLESEKLVKIWQEKFSKFPNIKLINYHKHFDYFLNLLKIEALASIEPLPGIAPSAKHIAYLKSTFNENNIDLIIMEPWHNKKTAESLAKALNLELLVLCPNVKSCPETNNILDLFNTNAKLIYKAIEKKRIKDKN